MDKTPILRINGKRYRANKLTVGAYRQIIWLIDDIGELPQDEFREDMVSTIQVTFGLTREEADLIPIDDVLPLFWRLAAWAQGIFAAKRDELPNENGLMAIPGQN